LQFSGVSLTYDPVFAAIAQTCFRSDIMILQNLYNVNNCLETRRDVKKWLRSWPKKKRIICLTIWEWILHLFRESFSRNYKRLNFPVSPIRFTRTSEKLPAWLGDVVDLLLLIWQAYGVQDWLRHGHTAVRKEARGQRKSTYAKPLTFYGTFDIVISSSTCLFYLSFPTPELYFRVLPTNGSAWINTLNLQIGKQFKHELEAR
jgi:hypothetical protein